MRAYTDCRILVGRTFGGTLKRLGIVFASIAVLGLIGYAGFRYADRRHSFIDDRPLLFWYTTWPWPAAHHADSHSHGAALERSRELLPTVMRELAIVRPASYEYPEWFVVSASPDKRYEVRTYDGNSDWDLWYVKDLRTGGLLEAYPGTSPENIVWDSGALVLDATGFSMRTSPPPPVRLHLAIDLDTFRVTHALVLE